MQRNDAILVFKRITDISPYTDIHILSTCLKELFVQLNLIFGVHFVLYTLVCFKPSVLSL